jgi:hypothetical protein
VERGTEVPGTGGFIWNEKDGIGYLPAEVNGQYGKEYFDKYVCYRASEIAGALMKVRADLVARYCGKSAVVDIGIGSGHFVEARGGETYGYDVNPYGIRWLLDRELWFDPFAKSPDVVTCWDSLEHMERPDLFVDRVRQLMFVSVPIFDGLEHVLRSKHFKPGEHLWYWTRHGFLLWMAERGFRCVEENQMERQLGREDIGTFVFSRIAT